jgi:nitrite reductase/ring-hydroxylating ferredoxin subunit
MADTHAPRSLSLICARSDLLDGKSGGKAHRFEIMRDGRKTPCFAFAFQGAIYAYVNRCPHQGTELDWLPGEVFDDDGLYLICATHGAVFEPDSGLCCGGPCRGASLERLNIDEVEGNVVMVGNDGLVAHLKSD